MKRSEMIKLLDKVINAKCDYGTVFWDSDLEEILIAIEKSGMLPPALGNETALTPFGDEYAIDHKWEQE